MYRKAYAAWVCGAVAVAATGHLAGCVFKTPLDCENALVDCGTGGASSSATSTGADGTGGTPISCIPGESSGPVAGSCGVFVSSSLGKDTNAGTKEAPLATIGAALTKAKVERVYVCAEALSFTEAVKISAPVELYGGLDCKSWDYVGAKSKTKLTAAADTVPLMLAGDTKIEDFAITAADATKEGGSSITVIADHATARLTRCDLVAGAGKAGLAGTTPPDLTGPTDPDDPLLLGNDGTAACSSPTKNDGGLPKENSLCPSSMGGPIGAAGGAGYIAYGSNGDSSPETAQTALGGDGQPTMDPPMSSWSCVNGAGHGGKNGNPGASGEGARGSSSIGTLDTSGFTGAPGWPGGPAWPGQGGGGGGGAKGKTICAGASGGGGGVGGCGGLGGTRGNAGGASIAVVSLDAALSFEQVAITTGAGGQGGDGGFGQGGGIGGNGGNGGIGASPTLAACNGGKGGQGGTGGKGGGGRGGHALGIAYTGATMPSIKSVTFSAKGAPGNGGAGADKMHDGDPGVQADLQAFP